MKTLHSFAIATLAAAGVAAAIPAVASADCYRRSENGTTGAIVGALAGAAIGNAASGRHDRGAGTAVGAVAGAAIGSSIARNNTDCYYDGYGYRESGYRQSYNQGYYRPAYRSYSYERVYVEPRRSYDYGYDGYDRRRDDWRHERHERHEREEHHEHYERYDRW
ncbi:MAG: glycine zipper 2TM domain-containing protein [Asticcacaulis sp.]|uniref:glycine zipper 2TM domain-containing protein n=1 Tax=Asticcacaulis sp. TaxID=1872648 RepID=UPI003F7B5CDD